MLKSFFLKEANTVVSRLIVLLIDVSIVLQTFFLAYLIRFNFVLSFQEFGFLSQLVLVAFLALFSFLIVGSHKGTIRHTGMRDAANVFYGVTILFVTLVIIALIHREFDVLERFSAPLTVLIIHFLLNVIVLIAGRFIFK
ncbi:MAG TPA: polysaccharide biosynthesis protein, partial [Flavobacteriaceae bacterium]|nr:polysaccharide biosynthesis protein [Flavobacteriaceae bacterium]